MAKVKGSDNDFPSILVTEQASKPTAPEAGKRRVYFKTDHKLYSEDSGGTEAAVGNGDVVGPASATNNHLAVFDGTTGKLVKDGGAPATGTGDVVGPASATNNHLVVFDGTTGKLIKDGGAPAAGTIGGATGSTDNAVLRADGTGGATVQTSLMTVDDSGKPNIPTGQTYDINGSPHTHTNPTAQALFAVEGVVGAATGSIRIYNALGRTVTISRVFLSVSAAPTGTAIIVDVNLDGITLFTNQAHRPQIAATAFTGETSTIDVSSWADGHCLTMDVDQVGSTIAGSDLTVHVVYS